MFVHCQDLGLYTLQQSHYIAVRLHVLLFQQTSLIFSVTFSQVKLVSQSGALNHQIKLFSKRKHPKTEENENFIFKLDVL